MTTKSSPPRTEIVPPLVLRLRPVVELTDDQLLRLSGLNTDLRLERTAEGALEVMPPAGWETSNRNIELATQVQLWTRQNGTGFASASSGGFRLPNGAVRAPDAAWVRRERLANLAAEQKRKFLPLCPDFVIELRSPSDSLATVQAKMREYIENGARLGWLLDPGSRRAYVYRPGEIPRILERPYRLSGEPMLPGFVLDLRPIWEPGF